jgi:hypothetical protein
MLQLLADACQLTLQLSSQTARHVVAIRGVTTWNATAIATSAAQGKRCAPRTARACGTKATTAPAFATVRLLSVACRTAVLDDAAAHVEGIRASRGNRRWKRVAMLM